ncbi:hypothetical protein BT69DRAFT_1324367 [Atractiella rhizophila]|nr:hypothetical protein BT69DRAFT_1324367 [Atractiella rhizophila]
MHHPPADPPPITSPAPVPFPGLAVPDHAERTIEHLNSASASSPFSPSSDDTELEGTGRWIKPADRRTTRDVSWYPASTYQCSSPPAAVNPIDPSPLWSWKERNIPADQWEEYLLPGIKFSVCPSLSNTTVSPGDLIHCHIHLSPQHDVSENEKVDIIFSGISTVDAESPEYYTFLQLTKSVILKELKPLREWRFEFKVPLYTNCACPRSKVPVPTTYRDTKFSINYSIQLRRNRFLDEISIPVIVQRGDHVFATATGLVANGGTDSLWKCVWASDPRLLTFANQSPPVPFAELSYHIFRPTGKASSTTIFLNYCFLIQRDDPAYSPNEALSSLMEKLQISLSRRILGRGGQESRTVLPIEQLSSKGRKVGVGISGTDQGSVWTIEGWIEITKDDLLIWDSCNAEMQVLLSAHLSHPALSYGITIETPIDDFRAIEVDIHHGVFTELPCDRSFYVPLSTSEMKAPSLPHIPQSQLAPLPNTASVFDRNTAIQASASVPIGNARIGSNEDTYSLHIRHIKSFESYKYEDLSSVSPTPSFDSFEATPSNSGAESRHDLIEISDDSTPHRRDVAGAFTPEFRSSEFAQLHHENQSETSGSTWDSPISEHQSSQRYRFDSTEDRADTLPEESWRKEQRINQRAEPGPSRLPLDLAKKRSPTAHFAPITSRMSASSHGAPIDSYTIRPTTRDPIVTASALHSSGNLRPTETTTQPLRSIRASPRGGMLCIYPMQKDLIGYWDHQNLRIEGRAPSSPSKEFHDPKTSKKLNKWTELRFDKDTYVEVRLDNVTVTPWSRNGLEWFKGQLLHLGNCQNPSFRFFLEQFATDDPKTEPILDADPFVRPIRAKQHLVSGKCHCHAGQESLINLCRFQLEANNAKGKVKREERLSRRIWRNDGRAKEVNGNEGGECRGMAGARKEIVRGSIWTIF